MELSVMFKLAFTVISGAIGVWGAVQKIRRGEAEKAVDEGQQALYTMAASLELLDSTDPAIMKAKNVIRQVGDITGAEKSTISKTVKQVQTLMKDKGFNPAKDETSNAQIERAAFAIKEFRAQKAKKSGMGKVLLLIGMFGLLSSCTTVPDVRLTSEIVRPASQIGGEVDMLVVEWPEGVKAEDVFTIDATSSADQVTRAQSLCELPSLAVPASKPIK